jgi:hypothetical protein
MTLAGHYTLLLILIRHFAFIDYAVHIRYAFETDIFAIIDISFSLAINISHISLLYITPYWILFSYFDYAINRYFIEYYWCHWYYYCAIIDYISWFSRPIIIDIDWHYITLRHYYIDYFISFHIIYYLLYYAIIITLITHWHHTQRHRHTPHW